MNRALLWLALPIVFLIALLGAVMQTPDFITVNFTVVWFAMVLVIMAASLGLLMMGMTTKEEPEKGEAHKDAGH